MSKQVTDVLAQVPCRVSGKTVTAKEAFAKMMYPVFIAGAAAARMNRAASVHPVDVLISKLQIRSCLYVSWAYKAHVSGSKVSRESRLE